MPYFLILPLFVVLIGVLITPAIIVRFVPRFARASGYLFGGTIGTFIGFVIVNLIVWMVGLFPVWLNEKVQLPAWLRNASELFAAGTLLIGPFIGSLIGVAVGFVAGLIVVHLRRRRRAPQ